MAEMRYGEVISPHSEGSGLGQLVGWAGALVSVGLIGGMAFWGWQLLVRDVTGVPVIEAMEGPARIAPADPGGDRAAHQGLAVNEIAEVGSAGGPANELRLAPEAEGLADEDRPQAELTGDSAEVLSQPPADPDGTMAVRQDEPLPIGDAPDDALATDRAVAEALANIAAEDGTASDGEAAADGDGIATSPRPASRPATLQRIRATVPLSATVPEVEEVDAAALPTGTRLVQLGAFETVDMARDRWASIGQQFRDYFGDKRRVVQQAQSGGRTFYRLRVEGFTDLADARRFCSALVAGGTDCVPVELR